MNWKAEYALLLLSSTGLTYLGARLMYKYKSNKKQILIACITVNLLILFFFKYFNWAGENIMSIMAHFNVAMHIPNLNVLLPVGISFYIFQALGYSIDVYRGDLEPEKNFFTYALFVSFFPQLVAGPIERSHNLLQQFKSKTSLNYDNFITGLNYMLWGYFMKLVIADKCAIYVNAIFNNIENHNGGSIALASVLFPFQLYGDFAGYSLIAIGVAKIMGFSLMQNFNHPYFFSTSIQDYWKRNHISLTTWFMDYVYYPMVGQSANVYWWCICIFITFVLSGFWHGANWTYVICFALFGLGLVWGVLFNKKQKRWEKKHGLKNNKYYQAFQYVTTFILVALILVFFRANKVEDGFYAIKQIFTNIDVPFISPDFSFALVIVFIAILFFKECIDEFGYNIHLSKSKYGIIKYAYFEGMILFIILFGVLNGGQFIYFQF